MNLRFVEAYYWAVSLQSVTRAAERLHLTQSALSARIASLEEELGVVLLDRRDKQFRLTTAGQRFHALAREMLELQRHVRAEMGCLSMRPTSLRIGTIESVLHSWLAGWLHATRETHADFELELTVETSPVLAEHLRRGALDLVFAAVPVNDVSVLTRPLPPMPMVFVGHSELYDKPHYRLIDLSSMELMTFQKGSQPHQTLLELFKRSRLPVPRVHAISSISAMVQLVEGGFGVATLPLEAAEFLCRNKPLRVLPVDGKLAALPIYASYRVDPTSNLTESVLDSALAYVERTGVAASA